MSATSSPPRLAAGLRRPMPHWVRAGRWTLPELQTHLQFAVDLELWTIPFYMAALYSVKDPASEAAQLVRSVVNQEMLHMQLAANAANAFGCEVRVDPPLYGQGVPHLDFDEDRDLPPFLSLPADSAIGPLDAARHNTMCLIEFPDTSGSPPESPSQDTYPTIGDFYASVAIGVEELAEHIQGGRRQVDLFRHFYPELDQPTVTRDGRYGLPQVQRLVQAIVSQGEGTVDRATLHSSHREAVPDWYASLGRTVPPEFQNEADDLRPAWDHYEKFVYLFGRELPDTWTASSAPSAEGRRAQERLKGQFGELCLALQEVFRGGSTDSFGPLMFQIGASVATCWKHGAVPVFSDASD